MAKDRSEYQRQWRASKGIKVGQPGRPITAPCGTMSSYKRHKRKGEPVDDACRQAYNAYYREYQREYQKKRRNETP